MRPTLIDLNDVELRVSHGEDEILRSPGYATLVDHKVEVGERGFGEAWRHPRQSHNRYWQMLDTSPLRHLGKRVRHAGDLAWLHLEELRRQAGGPERAMFILPGAYQRAQLSLLLGIAQAAGLQIDALVESAAAAGAVLAPGHYMHVEACLHQTVLTRLEVGEDDAVCVAREVLPELGYLQFEKRILGCVVDSFLTGCRFDALHEGSTEQLLHSQLGQWMSLLAQQGKVTLTIDHRGTRHEAVLQLDDVRAALAPLRRALIARAGTGAVVVDYRLARLPGLLDDWSNALALPAGAVFTGIAHSPGLVEPAGGGVSLRSQLACVPPQFRLAASHVTPVALASPASHLLVGDTAWELTASAWYLTRRGTVQRGKGVETLGAVIRGPRGAEVTASEGSGLLLNGEPVRGTQALRAGDHLTAVGSACLFVPISVHDDDAA
ncbi:MAG: hypothetical protein FJ164_12675 [Gammaproteobacteria bacterium]|nr:hypothetical protein [Gammaproteobacteria bacterium]